MVLSQYLINNGLDNLWVRNGNSDNPSISKITTTDAATGSLTDLTFSSPRVILQPESDPQGTVGSENIIVQFRIEAGKLNYTANAASPVVKDLAGSKLAYKASLSSNTLPASSPLAAPILSKLGSQAQSYSILQLRLQIAGLSTTAGARIDPVLAFSTVDSSTLATAVLNGLGVLMNKTLSAIDAQNLLVAGYNAQPNRGATSKLTMPQHHVEINCFSVMYKLAK